MAMAVMREAFIYHFIIRGYGVSQRIYVKKLVKKQKLVIKSKSYFIINTWAL